MGKKFSSNTLFSVNSFVLISQLSTRLQCSLEYHWSGNPNWSRHEVTAIKIHVLLCRCGERFLAMKWIISQNSNTMVVALVRNVS